MIDPAQELCHQHSCITKRGKKKMSGKSCSNHLAKLGKKKMPGETCSITECDMPRRSFWNYKCMCIFSGLPDEIMMYNVFSFLGVEQLCRNAVVCRRWNFLSTDRSLWSKIDLSKHTKIADPLLLTALHKKHGNGFEILKLCNCNLLTGSYLKSFFSLRFQRLRDLHLCNLHISDTVLVNIAKNCRGLSGLSLSGCLGVSDFGVQAIAKLCPKLEEVSLRRCSEITNKALLYFGETVKSLNVGSCTKIDGECLSILSQKLPNLERLNLHGIKVTDESIHQLAQGCTVLKTIHLSAANPFGGGSLLTDAVAVSLSGLLGLRCLNIQGSSNVTDAALAVLGCQCPSLQRLNVGGCYRLTDRGLVALATTSQLTHLSVFQCFNLTDRGVIAVMNVLPLEFLDLHSCVGLTGMCLTAIRPSGLKFLDIGSCRNISGDDVNALKQRIPELNIRHY